MTIKKNTKYAEVSSFVIDYIKTNNLQTGEMLPSETQLASMLNMSRITVRRAIGDLEESGLVNRVQGSGTYVSSKCENKTTTHYVPLILYGDDNSNIPLDIIRGANNFLFDNSCYLTVHFNNRNLRTEREIVNKLIDDGSRCIVIWPCTDNDPDDYFFRLVQRGVKFVFIDRIPANVSANVVLSDNLNGGYMATKHLIENGCKKIAFIEDVHLAHSQKLRFDGYRMALEDSGIGYSEEYAFLNVNADTTFFDRLMNLPVPPDGIFGCHDDIAINAVSYFSERSIAVPDDVAVIGFDNMPATSNLSISTIEQQFYNIGYEAAEIAFNILNGFDIYDVHKYLPTKVIQRNSSAKRNQ